MENIFPNFLKKDGFQFLKLENAISNIVSRTVKGIDMVDADEVVEMLVVYWKQELLLEKISWSQMRALRNFQQHVLSYNRRRKREQEERD